MKKLSYLTEQVEQGLEKRPGGQFLARRCKAKTRLTGRAAMWAEGRCRDPEMRASCPRLELLWTWEVIEGGVSGTLGSRLGFKELDGRCSHSPRNRIRADFMAGRRGAGRASSDLVAL